MSGRRTRFVVKVVGIYTIDTPSHEALGASVLVLTSVPYSILPQLRQRHAEMRFCVTASPLTIIPNSSIALSHRWHVMWPTSWLASGVVRTVCLDS